MISAGGASLTVWTQGQMVLESFVGMCMQDLSNEDTIADDPVEGKRRKVTRGTYSWKERY